MPIGVYRRTEETKRKMGKISHLRQANHCDLSNKAIEWISGELMGDGCLYSKNKYSAYFEYTSKHFEYINYVSDTLKSFGIEQAGKIYKNWKGKTFKNGRWVDRPITLFPKSFNYKSRCYPELKSIRDRWYPNGKKIIPKNLKLTSLTCRQHYIGDGSLLHPKNANPYIQLATCGFPIGNVEWLTNKLNNLGFKSTRQLHRNGIHISTYSTPAFLKYIGRCPCSVYDYKWKI